MKRSEYGCSFWCRDFADFDSDLTLVPSATTRRANFTRALTRQRTKWTRRAHASIARWEGNGCVSTREPQPATSMQQCRPEWSRDDSPSRTLTRSSSMNWRRSASAGRSPPCTAVEPDDGFSAPTRRVAGVAPFCTSPALISSAGRVAKRVLTCVPVRLTRSVWSALHRSSLQFQTEAQRLRSR
jgi:hypothetical protein